VPSPVQGISRDGELSYTSGGRTERLHISGGYVEIRDDDVRLLADKVE
jgi:F0F1-type ATP synthase epsilon subunit